MSNKVAVVTGANKGLGFAIVSELCKKINGVVYLTSRDYKRGVEACGKLEKEGLKPAFFQLDVTDSDSVKRFCDHVRQEHGKIDILINNAGVLFLKDSQEPKVYQAGKTISVNFCALVNFTEALIPFMNNGGAIVNISSSSGHLSRIPSEELRKKVSRDDLTLEALKALMREYVDAVKAGEDEGWGSSPYVVSKVGVNAYTFMLHRRLNSRDIAVNCVHPGYVQSDMTHGAGNVSPGAAAGLPVELALQPRVRGGYVWHDGSIVPWEGTDPREYIDKKQ